MSDIFNRITKNPRIELLLRIVTALILLYLFLVGVKTLSGGMKLMGSGFAKGLFDLTSNPILSLMAGMLATVLFQSSSVSTSIIVGLVAANTITVGGAVPMIMGANLGTSVTNTLVSLGFVRSKNNFKRAFAAATVHDFFNILSVAIILPIELATGFIERAATGLAAMLYGSATAGVSYSSPIKAAIKPVVGGIQSGVQALVPENMVPFLLVVIAGVIIISTLALIVKTMNEFIQSNKTNIIEAILSKNSFVTIGIGVLVTIAVQSSSITTSLLVPLAGSGVMTLQSVYALTVGANIGTTATAMIAALTGNMAGLAIALVHLIFNLLGTFIFFLHPGMRQIPIWCAETLASSMEKTKYIGLGYVCAVFFCIPLSAILFFR